MLTFSSFCGNAKAAGTGDELPEFPPYSPRGNEPRVAVLNFENDTFFDSPSLGASIATMFETAIVRSRRCRVVDRENLARIRDISPTDVAQIGDVLRTDYLIRGGVKLMKVTSVGSSTSLTESEGWTSGLGGSLANRELTATVRVEVDYVDATTGRTVYTGSRTAEVVSSKLGVGVVYRSVAVSVSGGIEGFDQTIAGAATRKAAYQIVAQMIAEGVFARN